MEQAIGIAEGVRGGSLSGKERNAPSTIVRNGVNADHPGAAEEACKSPVKTKAERRFRLWLTSPANEDDTSGEEGCREQGGERRGNRQPQQSV